MPVGAWEGSLRLHRAPAGDAPACPAPAASRPQGPGPRLGRVGMHDCPHRPAWALLTRDSGPALELAAVAEPTVAKAHRPRRLLAQGQRCPPPGAFSAPGLVPSARDVRCSQTRVCCLREFSRNSEEIGLLVFRAHGDLKISLEGTSAF